MKVVSIVGARPQFVKAAVMSRRLRERHVEVLVHTGQHYDLGLSAVFFEELAIPEPAVNLGVGSGPHGAQTGAMLEGIERVLLAQRPDWTIVFGDTNSTLAGSLAAAKLHVPVAHVEAGLRSFNRAMPEEVNRIVTDHLSDQLLCPSRTAIENLAAEGIVRGAHLVGDLMADALAFADERARARSCVLDRLGLAERGYGLATIHRAENTGNPLRLAAILAALDRLDEPVVFPAHPRTLKACRDLGVEPSARVRLIEPVGYLDMVQLERSARVILTDSGGVQKEAYWLGVPCLTLREETEWVETVEAGWNVLVGAETARIVETARTFRPPASRPALYVEGGGAARCVECLERGPRR